MRGKTHRNGRRGSGDGGGPHIEGGRRLTGQHGEGVLVLGSRDVHIRILGLGAGKLGLRQSDIGLRCHAAVIAVGGELQVLVVGCNGLVEHLHLHVLRRQQEVVGRQQRLLAEPDVFEIGRAHLRVAHRILDRQTNPAPQIRFPSRGCGQRKALTGGTDAPSRIGSRVALRDRRGRADGGIVVGVRGGDQCPRLPELGFRLLDILVIDVDHLFQTVQFRIAENLPPLALEQGIAGSGHLPLVVAGHFLKGHRRGRHGPLVFGADGTTGRE